MPQGSGGSNPLFRTISQVFSTSRVFFVQASVRTALSVRRVWFFPPGMTFTAWQVGVYRFFHTKKNDYIAFDFFEFQGEIAQAPEPPC